MKTPIFIALMSITSMVAAATSTGSTSTGSTSTGSVIVPVSNSIGGAGGPVRTFNLTTKQWEMLPQCFPFVFASQFYVGDLTGLYENQAICRAQRKIDFNF